MPLKYSIAFAVLVVAAASCAQSPLAAPTQGDATLSTQPTQLQPRPPLVEASNEAKPETTPEAKPDAARAEAAETPLPATMRVRLVPDLGTDQAFTLALLDEHQALVQSDAKPFELQTALLYRELRLHSDTLVGRAYVPPLTEEVLLHLQAPSSLRFVLGEVNPALVRVAVDIPGEEQPRRAAFVDGVAVVSGLIPETLYTYSLGAGYARKFQVRTLASGEERFIPVFADSMVSVAFESQHPQELKQARFLRIKDGSEAVAVPLAWKGDVFTLPLSAFSDPTSSSNPTSPSYEFLDGQGNSLGRGNWREPRFPLVMSIASNRRDRAGDPVTGRVVDGQGNPVAGVSVNDGETITGADGRFVTHNKRLKLRRGMDGQDLVVRRGKRHYEVELHTAKPITVDVRTPTPLPLMIRWRSSNEVIALSTNQRHTITKPAWENSATIGFGVWMGQYDLFDANQSRIVVDATSLRPTTIHVQSGVQPNGATTRDVVVQWSLPASEDRAAVNLYQLVRADAKGSALLQLPKERVSLSGFNHQVWNPSEKTYAWDSTTIGDKKQKEAPTSLFLTTPESVKPAIGHLYGKRLGSPHMQGFTFATLRLEGVVDIDDLRDASAGIAQAEFHHLTPSGYICHIKPSHPAQAEYPYVYISAGDRQFRCIGRMEKTELGFRFDFDAAEAFNGKHDD